LEQNVKQNLNQVNSTTQVRQYINPRDQGTSQDFTDYEIESNLSTDVSTPCKKIGDTYVCRAGNTNSNEENNESVPLNQINTLTNQINQFNNGGVNTLNNLTNQEDKVSRNNRVIDISAFSNSVLYLILNGDIIREVDNLGTVKRTRIKNNVILSKIVSFAGELYGLNSGILYQLSLDTFNSKRWIWRKSTIPLSGIVHVNATHSGNNLWIQNSDTGYLYDKSLNLISSQEFINMIRIYGNDENRYIDINKIDNTAIIYPSRRRLTNVYTAILDYNGNETVISISERSKYSDVKLVNWREYFIQV